MSYLTIGVSYVISVVGYILLLPVSYPAAVLVSLFTAGVKESPERRYAWGWIFGTYDNPPQGDNGWITKRSYFPNVISGWKGYTNRVGWMIRNKLYGFKKLVSLPYKPSSLFVFKGDSTISDKTGVSGYLWTRVYDKAGRLYGWEWYSITPYWNGSKCIRIRLGWKIKGRKFTKEGDFAPLVFTINFFDNIG